MKSYNQDSKIKGALRNVARYIPEKKEAIRRAIHPTEKGPRGGSLIICNHCGRCFPIKDIQVDHIIPVIPVNRKIKDWNEYIERLFCPVENLQCLCKDCHLIKTNSEYLQKNENRL